MEQVALVIPTEYWPDAFDAVLQGWEIRVGMAAPELEQDFSTRTGKNNLDITDPGRRCSPTLTAPS